MLQRLLFTGSTELRQAIGIEMCPERVKRKHTPVRKVGNGLHIFSQDQTLEVFQFSDIEFTVNSVNPRL